MKKNNFVPRGIRNNNPLNIERNPKTAWVGMNNLQTDRRFVQFVSIEYGIRAAFIILRNYWYKHRLRTLRKMINRWCPPSEKGNLTSQYVNYVAMKADILPDEELEAPDKGREIWKTIVNKMILVECGRWIDYGVIGRAWDLAYGKGK